MSTDSEKSTNDIVEELLPTIRTIKKLQESGIMAMIDAVADNFDELFNYASSMPLMDGISLLVKIAPMASVLLKSIDMDKLQKSLESIPWDRVAYGFNSITDFMAKDMEKVQIPQTKASMLRALGEIETPEMQYLLNIAIKFARRIMDDMENLKKTEK